ncbi:MAG: hypothetical protein R3C26_00315 [Calditrichia bacterium]
MIKQAIAKFMDGKDLSRAEAYQVMDEILSGQATEAQVSGVSGGVATERQHGGRSRRFGGCLSRTADTAIDYRRKRGGLQWNGRR